MLPEITVFTGIKLGARVIEIFILDEGTKVWVEEVVGSRNNIPSQVGVTPAATSIDRNSTGYGIYDLGPSRFRIVTTNTSAGVRLKPSKVEAQDEVRQERAAIDPSVHVALCDNVTQWVPQVEISAAAETIVEEIALKGWSNYASAKDVAQFETAKETDVIFRIHIKAVSEEWVTRIILCKCSVVTAVLIKIRSHVDAAIKTYAI